jgi:hypothetical protein
MILLTDEMRASGFTTTTHYTHPPRSVVMQIALSGRADYTQTAPGDPVLRGFAFFTSFIAAGVETDLTAAPLYGAGQFRADAVTEVRAQLIAQNCGTTAVVTQFNRLATMPANDSVDAAVQFRTVAFRSPANNTIKYKHIVKVFAGGRTVSEQEAIDSARSNAKQLSVDITGLQMKVTINDENEELA